MFRSFFQRRLTRKTASPAVSSAAAAEFAQMPSSPQKYARRYRPARGTRIAFEKERMNEYEGQSSAVRKECRVTSSHMNR